MEAGRMIIYSVVFALFQNTFTVCFEDIHDNTKRILLNDQDVAGQLNRNIQSLTQMVNTMKTQMDAQKADMISFDAKISSKKAEITALEGKLSSQKAEVAAQKQEIATLKEEFAAQEAKITAQEVKITNQEAKITSHEAEITSQEAEIIAQKAEIAVQKAEAAVYKAEVAKLTVKTSTDAGSTYYRWGRTSCSAPNSTLVYQGYTTGQHYNQYSNRFGGPANMLCLPNDPELSNVTSGSGSFLWGTEFEENIIKADAADEDVPCAVCKSTDTHVSIMIPGRTTCYGGWKVEYNGILLSDYYANSASSFICIDSNPEYIPSGKRNDNGRLLYVTHTKCGALPCPPYTDGKAVNCVVCSQ